MEMNPAKPQDPGLNSGDGIRACPLCATHFRCDILAGEGHCWCFDLPNLLPVVKESVQGCLCPHCLREAIEKIQQAKRKG